MNLTKSNRGFWFLMHDAYPTTGGVTRLVSESSVVGHYDDALDRPGSSALWIGEGHHLYREEVAELVEHLQRWLSTGRLGVDAAQQSARRAEAAKKKARKR